MVAIAVLNLMVTMVVGLLFANAMHALSLIHI